jgi:2-(1,2-epoxy-1,2-dihydrophenyl)acetyl-CoA isomerase
MDAALEAEVQGQLRLLQSSDFAEGVTAFFGKRPPEFSGK